MKQIDKKTALAAAQIIKDYCRQQDCKYCIFGNLSNERRRVSSILGDNQIGTFDN